jgi:hypothetical protein
VKHLQQGYRLERCAACAARSRSQHTTQVCCRCAQHHVKKDGYVLSQSITGSVILRCPHLALEASMGQSAFHGFVG